MDAIAINTKTRQRKKFPEKVFNVLEEDGEWQLERWVDDPQEAERKGEKPYEITQDEEFAFEAPQPVNGGNQALFEEILKGREENQKLLEQIKALQEQVNKPKAGRPSKQLENA